MKNNLTSEELKSLVKSVFSLSDKDKKIAILIDVPDEIVKDNPNWQQRRKIAKAWQIELNNVKTEIGLENVNLIF